ncbi:MAG: leucine-rich repeat domain-containing protein [Oscillibacter sp.]|nr:leucine-rich repeat domain-containing protein [Oscillibacter sp.]
MDSLASQVQRVQQKLIAMQRCFPMLISLDPPVSLQWVVSFESAHGMTLSTDYVQIITQTADGGLMPSFLSQRYWRSLHILNSSRKTMHLPFPLDGSFTQTDGAFDAQSLPGQWLLMGGPDLGWSLITTGPFQGEVWTLGAFGATRAPACTFSQWLELVLDGTLGDYMQFCLTGMEGPVSLCQQFFDLLRRGPVWTENPSQKCALWLDRHRKPLPKTAVVESEPVFHYVGPSRDGGQFAYQQLASALRPLPEESSPELAALRAAQSSRLWRWGRRKEAWLSSQELRNQLSENRVHWEDPVEMRRLGELARAVLANGPEAVQVSPEEAPLLAQAVRLTEKKYFNQQDSSIRNLCFLEGLTNLRQVDFRRNDIEDLTPLAGLPQFKRLGLSFNLISDLSPLANLEQLSALSLSGNRITSLEPLRGLRNLRDLSLRGNPLEAGTLACLRKCKHLGMLDFVNTGLQDISDLEFCRAWNLDLYGNPDLTGLEILPTMKNLSCLYLDTQVAQRYDIPNMMPRFTEYAELGGISLYIWPEKYYN